MAKAPRATGLTTAAVRAIQALGAAPNGRADQIADRLAEAIGLGLIAPGERLPAEAVLSEQLGVATLTLREALATLRERGLVVTRRGRAGGSFVAEPSGFGDGGGVAGGVGGVAGVSAPMLTLPLTLRRLSELGDLRRATLTAAAALAARRATEPEIEALRRRVRRLAAARSAGERRRADGEFGIELAAAAQSPRLTQDEANLRAELGDLVWTLLDDAERTKAVRVREALVDAVAEGDDVLAGRLAEQQIARETELLMRWRIDLYRAEASSGSGSAPSPSPQQTWSALADEIEHIFQHLQATADAFAASYLASRSRSRSRSRSDPARAERPDRYALADLAPLRPRIRETLDAFQGLAVGTGIVVAPDVLDDAPYWLEWWWRRAGGAPESLRVNLDPDGPDFFDYVNNEWFDVPIKDGRRHVAGPYVDYACTNQYTFTLSVPVYHGGRPLGVAAMDVPCDRIEHRIMLALCADDAPRALLNANGRVIAASSVPPAPGVRLTGPRRVHGSDGGGSGDSAADPVGPPGSASEALARLCELTGWTTVPLPAPRLCFSGSQY